MQTKLSGSGKSAMGQKVEKRMHFWFDKVRRGIHHLKQYFEIFILNCILRNNYR